MSARVVSEVGTSGRLLARKRSRDDADATRLAHEADVLALAQHPGVVELVAGEHDGTGVALVTGFAGTHSLDTIGPMGVERAAGVVAALAETVGDLHDLGLVHGRIDPSHVIIGAGGRPVLCGFAGGGRIGTTPPPGPTAAPGFGDPAATGEALAPPVDVYGLGCLLRTLTVDAAGVDVEPIPDHRFALGRVRAPWAGYQRRALLTLADRATDEMPSRRPPARRLAADIIDTIPSAHLSDDADPFAALRSSADDIEPSRRARWVSLIAIGAGLVLVLLGITGLRGDGSAAGSAELAPAPAPGDTTVSTSDTTAYVDDHGVIVVGTQRFSVGLPGDRVAVGDWNCDGVSTVAVLRPSTGAVFVFDGWASDGDDVSVAPARIVTGAVDVAARDRSDGCSTLVVVHDDGTEEEIIS